MECSAQPHLPRIGSDWVHQRPNDACQSNLTQRPTAAPSRIRIRIRSAASLTRFPFLAPPTTALDSPAATASPPLAGPHPRDYLPEEASQAPIRDPRSPSGSSAGSPSRTMRLRLGFSGFTTGRRRREEMAAADSHCHLACQEDWRPVSSSHAARPPSTAALVAGRGGGAGRAVGEHYPVPGRRRRGEAQLRPPGPPRGVCAPGPRPLRRLPPLQPQERTRAGSTATASCSPPATAACSTTHCSTSQGTKVSR
jgi:hypothetical protein